MPILSLHPVERWGWSWRTYQKTCFLAFVIKRVGVEEKGSFGMGLRLGPGTECERGPAPKMADEMAGSPRKESPKWPKNGQKMAKFWLSSQLPGHCSARLPGTLWQFRRPFLSSGPVSDSAVVAGQPSLKHGAFLEGSITSGDSRGSRDYLDRGQCYYR